MSITKSDFWNFATAIGNDFASNPKLRKKITATIAKVCEYSNPRFDWEKFTNAVENVAIVERNRKNILRLKKLTP